MDSQNVESGATGTDNDNREAGVSGDEVQMDQKVLKDQSDCDLVVNIFMATVSFTAGLTVPGGYISDGPNKGTAVLAKKRAFKAFVILNAFALLFSVYAVFSHYCARRLISARRLIKDEDILSQLRIATNCTLYAMYAMMAAFIAGSFAVLADSIELAISVCAICCCFYIFSIHPIWKLVKQKWGRFREAATNWWAES